MCNEFDPEDDDLYDGPNDGDDDEPPYDDEEDYECDDPDDDDRSEFADPGGNSSLRAATPDNPRNLPCGSCNRPDMLTPKDVARGYQCDICADEAEGGGY